MKTKLTLAVAAILFSGIASANPEAKALQYAKDNGLMQNADSHMIKCTPKGVCTLGVQSKSGTSCSAKTSCGTGTKMYTIMPVKGKLTHITK